jgi:mannose-6-phosphate isomerase-like protein (cupin superfamily)
MDLVSKTDVTIPIDGAVSANNSQKFHSINLDKHCDDLAPDGSEIRLLIRLEHGGVCHCTLPEGMTSTAVTHRTVEEIWYVLSGDGEMWRKNDEQEEVTRMKPGLCISIPLGTRFQFRNIGRESLCILITTMPPWPGKEEAVIVQNHWT